MWCVDIEGRLRRILGAALVLFATCVSAAAAAGSVPRPPLQVGPQRNVAVPDGAIVLTPGTDIQRVVAAHPPRTTFYLDRGVYRLQQIIPKSGDSFIGAYGAVLSGAVRLTSFARQGRYFVAAHTPAPGREVTGMCLPTHPRCNRPEAVFFDGKPLEAVADLRSLHAGAFYFDYGADRIYLLDNPKGHGVEVTYTPFAFGGPATGVMIRNLVVEKYGSANQQGTVGNHGEGAYWTVENNEIRWNNGYGLVHGTHSRTLGNFIHHNGEMGLGAGSGNESSLVQGNEIAYNYWNGTNCSWECGGAKWGDVRGLAVVANYVHDNQGDGLWTDERSREILYQDNLIVNNRLAGISHEISGECRIIGNVVIGNGKHTHDWGWNAQIQIQNATDVEVADNVIAVDKIAGGNGIAVIQQNRGEQFLPQRVRVHDNRIIVPQADGVAAGLFADYLPHRLTGQNVVFDHNTYIVAPAVAGTAWFIRDAYIGFAGWQAAGEDPHGTWVR